MRQVLIVNDGRVGHLNQSIAFAKHAKLRYDIVDIAPKYILSKSLSYLFDRLHIDYPGLFKKSGIGAKEYAAVIGAGSSSYYLVKSLAKRFDAKSIAMMLPKGFRLGDFDVIFAPEHDNPPKRDNIIPIPANFAYIEPNKIYRPYAESIGIVIGGASNRFNFSASQLEKTLRRIRSLYAGYEIAVTTSPRTSEKLEKVVESFEFDFEVIFSKNPVNPIGDMLFFCERVFITADSTSMVSEAVSAGCAHVELLDFGLELPDKFERFVSRMQASGYLHRFDGTKAKANRKIDFSVYASKVKL